MKRTVNQLSTSNVLLMVLKEVKCNNKRLKRCGVALNHQRNRSSIPVYLKLSGLESGKSSGYIPK